MSNQSKTSTISNSFFNIFKGILLGIANIIPGVSGGTFALILGIYERILTALNSIDASSIRILFAVFISPFKQDSRKNFSELLKRLDAWFLTCLALGGAFAVLSLSFLIDWLLTHHPAYTLSFFIGLIVPSIAVPWKMIGTERTWGKLLWILPGIIITIAVSFSFGRLGNVGDNLLWCFLTGMIAISAMILPGISGSFVMLVMGQYQNVLKKLQLIQTTIASGEINIDAFIWLGTFAIGCIFGLILFARFLGFLLKHQRGATLAFLIGLIIGSLWILWPFKDYDYQPDLTTIAVEYQERVSEKQDIRVATAPNQLPSSGIAVLSNLIFLGIGFAGAMGLNYIGKKEITAN